MSETCGCGAKTDGVDSIDLIREWRREHRHEAAPVKVSPTGATSSIENTYPAVGFRA